MEHPAQVVFIKLDTMGRKIIKLAMLSVIARMGEVKVNPTKITTSESERVRVCERGGVRE